jgi:hypothetical protein
MSGEEIAAFLASRIETAVSGGDGQDWLRAS